MASRSLSDIQRVIATFTPDQISDNNIPAGCLLFLYTESKGPKGKASFAETSRRLQSILGYEINVNCCKSKIQALLRELTKAKKGINHDSQWAHFNTWMRECIIIKPADSASLQHQEPRTPSTSRIVKSRKIFTRKLRSECHKCNLYKSKNVILSAKNALLSSELFHAQNMLSDVTDQLLSAETEVKKKESAVAEKATLIKQISKKLARKTVKQTEIKKFATACKEKFRRRTRDPLEYARLLKNERIRSSMLSKRKEELVEEVSSLKKQMAREEKQYIEYIDFLEMELEEKRRIEDGGWSDDVEDGTERRQYDYKTRKVMYKSLECKVPIAQSSNLVTYAVTEFSDTQLARLPSESTISRMAYEVSALSLLHATEVLLRSDCATLGWDATSIDAQHINEIHVHTPDKTFTLSISVLPGGTAADYFTHITTIINRMSTIYSEYHHDIPHFQIKKEIINKISSTVTDRVVTNHAVVRALNEEWSKDLIELHCNLHPMDGFANQVRSALKKLDAELGMPTTGRDCCVSNFLYGLSKLRIKQTGDPSGFTAHLTKNNLSPALIPRYVGNRWNLIFKMSDTVIQHHQLLTDYLVKFCKNETGLRKDLVWGIGNESLLEEFKALALINLVITTPWMTSFYSNKDSLSNLEMVPLLQTFAINLQKFSDDPFLMFTTSSDIFDRPLGERPHHLTFEIPQIDSLLVKCIHMMIAAITKISNSQLARYTTGIFADVTPEMIKATRASAPHNIWAERTLGSFNTLWIRGKQASVNFVESKVMMVSNNMMEWLNCQSPTEQQHLIEFAVKVGRKLRKEEALRKKDLQREAWKRLDLVAQKRSEKERKEFEVEIVGVLKSREESGFSDDGFSRKEVFLSMDEEYKKKVLGVLRGDSMKGLSFVQDWFEDEEVVTYHAVVKGQKAGKVRKNGLPTFNVKYWLPGFEEEEASHSHNTLWV